MKVRGDFGSDVQEMPLNLREKLREERFSRFAKDSKKIDRLST